MIFAILGCGAFLFASVICAAIAMQKRGLTQRDDIPYAPFFTQEEMN